MNSAGAVKLIIVKKDPDLSSEAVLQHCRAHLTNYKVPRVIEFRDSLPKSGAGKLMWRQLQDEEKGRAA